MSEAKAAKGWKGPRYLSPIKRRKDLLAVTRQMSELVRAHAPFVEGLHVAATDAPNSGVRNVLLAVCEHVSAGEPLHKALEQIPGFFPRYYANIVKSGELSGTLEKCLAELEEELIRSTVFLSEIRALLTYPAVATLHILVVATGLLVWVVPQFAEIFRSFDSELPARTQALIFISDSPLGFVLLVLCAFVVLVVIGPNFLRCRLKAIAFPILRLPYIWGLVKKLNLGQAASVLEKMLGAGMPLHEALDNVAALDIDPVFTRSFARLKDRVVQGESLKSAMEKESAILGPSFCGLAALGESSGLLPEAFGRIADFYRAETSKRARILLSIAEPAMVCCMGALVYFIFSGLFLALISLPQLVDI